MTSEGAFSLATTYGRPEADQVPRIQHNAVRLLSAGHGIKGWGRAVFCLCLVSIGTLFQTKTYAKTK